MLANSKITAPDVASVGAIPAVPEILRVLCEITGMKFAVIARVTATQWAACAVLDQLGMGIGPGHELDIGTTFCQEVRTSRAPIVIDSVSADLRYRDHLTPKIYNFESYVSVPILLPDGSYFGSLCALDRRPHQVSDPRIQFMFLCCASLLAQELQRSLTLAQDPPAWTTPQQVLNLRSLFIAMLIHADSGGADGAQRTLAGTLLSRLAATPDQGASLAAEVLVLMRDPLCAGSRIDRRSCTDLALRLRAVVVSSRLAHPVQRVISNITFGGPIYCDVEWIERLASCMLDGALGRGSQSAAVSFVVKVKAQCLVLSVWNQGDTLSVSEFGGPFRPDWRSMTDPSTASAALHTCSEVVRAHRGTIEATSSSVDGTQITARIPLRSRAA